MMKKATRSSNKEQNGKIVLIRLAVAFFVICCYLFRLCTLVDPSWQSAIATATGTATGTASATAYQCCFSFYYNENDECHCAMPVEAAELRGECTLQLVLLTVKFKYKGLANRV